MSEDGSVWSGPLPLVGLAVLVVYALVFYDAEAEMYGLVPESVVLFLRPELTESEYSPVPAPAPIPTPSPVDDFVKPLEPEQPAAPEEPVPPVEVVEPLVPNEEPPLPPQFTQPEQPIEPPEEEPPEETEEVVPPPPPPPPPPPKPEEICQYHGMKINSVSRRKCRDDNGCFWEYTGNSDREEKRGVCKARQPTTEAAGCEEIQNRWRCSKKQDCRWAKSTKCTTRPPL